MPGVRWAATFLLTFAALSAFSQPGPSDVDKIKAELLYKLALFLYFPSSSVSGSDSFMICVLGKDPLGTALGDAVKYKGISGRKVIAKRIADISETTGCSVLYIWDSEAHPMPEVAWALGNKSILTVGEGSQFTLSGGMINFRTEGNRVRFEINAAAAKRAGLKISSKLLNVASSVGGEAAPNP